MDSSSSTIEITGISGNGLSFGWLRGADELRIAQLPYRP
jgi:hypothetical protein